MKAKLKKNLLLALLACNGVPMPQIALLTAARSMCHPDHPTNGDAEDALKDIEAEGYATGVTDEFSLSATWTLTEKGTHKARQLR